MKDNYSGAISFYLWGTLHILLITPITTAIAETVSEYKFQIRTIGLTTILIEKNVKSI